VHDNRANAVWIVRFARADCATCTSRGQRTRSKSGRLLTLDTQETYTLLAQARMRQQTDGFKTEYGLRSGVESLMSQVMRACDIGRTRYLGQARTHLQHVLIAVAISLVGLVD
jgi:transposase